MVSTWIISLAFNSLAPPLWLSSPLLAVYFIIIQKTRNELAEQTKRALDAFREKAEVAEANERLAFRAEQRVEMQELRQKIQLCETDKGDMIVKLAGAQAKITILEARVGLLENGAGH